MKTEAGMGEAKTAEPLDERNFFDLCDSINGTIEEGHEIANCVIGVTPTKSRETATDSVSNDVPESSVELLKTKLRYANTRISALVVQLQRISESF